MTSFPRIGILTFHRCINYGSYWQARCLVEGLRSRGFDVAILDHFSSRIERAELVHALGPISPVRAAETPLYARKIEKFNEAVESLPLSPAFPLEEPARLPAGFDTVLVGSDEVWNQRHPWYGACKIFFGWGLPTGRLVSYGASFGNQPPSDELCPEASALRSFSALSVRDMNSRTIAERIVGAPIEVVLDPCLQFPEPIARAEVTQAPYLLLYGHDLPDWFCSRAVKWAHERSLGVVSVGYRNDWADAQWIAAGPAEFAQAMAAATAVATTFFHGAVFALVNGKPFICASSPYRHNKLSDLMTLLGTQERLVGEDVAESDFGSALQRPPGEAVMQRIEALRRRSNAYLQEALMHEAVTHA
ncbi:polysaccharide pyruvyl transferase family protein [Mesorhizobium sp. KR2-14]|uniref:polysaccharide pyruvyl transferase family protein n=1 Tax=Mesorhizobium sp. KR2-14 TaxID=3156610 RepID=UPI0032B4D583